MHNPEIVFIEDEADANYRDSNIFKKRNINKDLVIFRNIRYTYHMRGYSFTSKYLQVFIQLNHIQEMIGMGVFINKQGNKEYPNEDMLRDDDFCFVGNQVYYNNLKKMCVGKELFDQIKDCMILNDKSDAEFVNALCRKYKMETIDEVKKYLNSGSYTYQLKCEDEDSIFVRNNKVYLIGDKERSLIKQSLKSVDKKEYFRRVEEFHFSTRGFSDVIDEPSRKLFIVNNSVSKKQNKDVDDILDIDNIENYKNDNEYNDTNNYDEAEEPDFNLKKEENGQKFDQIKIDSMLDYGSFTDLGRLWDEKHNLSINDTNRVYKQIRKLGERFPKYHESYYNFMISGKDYIAFNPVDYDEYFYPLFVLVQIIQKAKKNSFVIIDFDKISNEIQQVTMGILTGLKNEKEYMFKTFIYKSCAKKIKEFSDGK